MEMLIYKNKIMNKFSSPFMAKSPLKENNHCKLNIKV